MSKLKEGERTERIKDKSRQRTRIKSYQ